MHKLAVALGISFLIASAACWDSTARQEILDALVTAVDGTSTAKATDAYKTILGANTQILEIYDNFLNYNSDYLDRVGEDAIEDAFTAAETNMQLPATSTILPKASYDATNGVAITKFYYVGAYCYSFNPCVALKIGYHVSTTIPEGDRPAKPEDFDGDAFAQSYAAMKIPELKAVIQAKLNANK